MGLEASKYIQSLFDKYDIDIIGITPKVAGGNRKRSSNSWRENEIKEYLSNPTTWVAWIVFIFSLWGAYATLNNRMANVEDKVNEIDIIEIKTQLKEISTNIAWIQKDIEYLKENK